MKQLFISQPVRLLVMTALTTYLALATALAQRTDSLMVRSDAISAYSKTILNNVLYYLADDGKTGFELWRTDGTPTGTRLVKDIRPGKASAFVSDTSYYTGIYNSTTYRYDYDLTTVRSYLRYVQLYIAGNQLYFWADDGVSGVELWRTDGTEAGTQQVTDLLAGPFDSGSQYDILFGGYNGRFSQTTAGKLLFWPSNITNTLFETDGTLTGTRAIDVQATKYINSAVSGVTTRGTTTYAVTSFYQKGKSYYSLLQLPVAQEKSTTLVANSLGYPSLLDAGSRGVYWTAAPPDDKLLSTSLFRKDTGQAKLIRRFDIAKPTVVNTRSQYVSNVGRLGNQLLLQVADQPYSNQAGKGSTELWTLNMQTDSLRLIRKYNSEQTYVNNQTRYLKGIEILRSIQILPAGLLVVHGTADTTGTETRNTISRYDEATNKFQVLEDSVATYYYWQYGPTRQAVFMTRRGQKDPFKVWTTNGKTRIPLQTLSVSEGLVLQNVPGVGLVAAQWTPNLDAKKALIGYKMEVWRIDTTAANISRIGRVANAAWIGDHIGSNGVLYGLNNGSYLQRVTATSPTDSIRAVASIYNGSVLIQSENNFGILNGKLLAKAGVNSPLLLAIDPAGKPRKCAIALTSKTKNGNPYSFVKDLAYCPAKDSVATLKRAAVVQLSTNTGEINNIYFNTLQWLRDSTILQTGTAALDSVVLRKAQQGQYTLSLRGIAEGCQATDSYRLLFSSPAVSLVPSLKQADRKAVSAIATGGYLNNGSTYTSTWSRTNADGSVAAVAGSGNVSIYGSTTGWMDEFVASKYEPRYGTYSVQIADVLSCSATGSFTFTDKTTFLTLTGGFGAIRNGATICDQSVVSYTATAGGGKAPYTYRWLSASQPVALGSSGSFTAISPETNGTGSRTYSVEATDADGNKLVTDQQYLYFAALPLATLTSTSLTASATRPATLSATVANYNFPTFRWAKDGAVITGVAGKSLSATSGGLYSLTVGSGTTENCQRTLSIALVTGSGRVAATTPALTYEAAATSGYGGGTPDPLSPRSPEIPTLPALNALQREQTQRGTMTVLPNPVQHVSRLQLDLPKPAGVAGTLMSLDGKVLHTWEDARPFEQYTTDVNLSSQPAGVYLLRIEAGGQTYTKRIVKQ